MNTQPPIPLVTALLIDKLVTKEHGSPSEQYCQELAAQIDAIYSSQPTPESSLMPIILDGAGFNAATLAAPDIYLGIIEDIIRAYLSHAKQPSPDTDGLVERVTAAILNCELPDGFDRNGSHNSGQYQEYKWSLRFYLREQDHWKAEELAKAAIAAMGEVAGRVKSSASECPLDESLSGGVAPTHSPANHDQPDLCRCVKPSEISVVDDFRDKISNALECASLFVLKHCDKPKAVEVIQAINVGRDALRLHKPVSVSQLWKSLEGEFSKYDTAQMRQIAFLIAVLDAAGVKYVD